MVSWLFLFILDSQCKKQLSSYLPYNYFTVLYLKLVSNISIWIFPLFFTRNAYYCCNINYGEGLVQRSTQFIQSMTVTPQIFKYKCWLEMYSMKRQRMNIHTRLDLLLVFIKMRPCNNHSKAAWHVIYYLFLNNFALFLLKVFLWQF